MSKHFKEKPPSNKNADLAYYITQFKLEGHSTWRVQMFPSKSQFDMEWAKSVNAPPIVERRTTRFDRITGIMEEI